MTDIGKKISALVGWVSELSVTTGQIDKEKKTIIKPFL